MYKLATVTTPTRVKIVTGKTGARNWGWRLLDFYYHEVERGTGCRTRDEAYGAGLKAKTRYLENLDFFRLQIILKD